MTTIDIDIARDVFNAAYLPSLEDMSRVQIVYGGSGSGKSVAIAQREVMDVLKGGRNYLNCRQVARTLRLSVYQEIIAVINSWGLEKLFHVNKNEMLITCSNGYQMAFVGLDDVEKLKSIRPARGAWTDIWIEEATETARDSVKQLLKRQRGGSENIPKRLTLSFNPIFKTHWIYTDYFASIGWADDQTRYQGDGLSILKTWYVHNKFLTTADVQDLVNEADPYYRSVYTLGNWGVLGNVIFTNWEVRDLSGMRNQFTNCRYGLDFGYAKDPAAFVGLHYDAARKEIYIFDELYQTGLTNDLLAEAIKSLSPGYITADSAEPKSIQELTNLGLNITGAEKGKDSVLHGVQWLQQHKIIIDAKCINAQNEFSTYHWKEDKSGDAIPIPVDKNNHIIDAIRYALEDEMSGGWILASSRY